MKTHIDGKCVNVTDRETELNRKKQEMINYETKFNTLSPEERYSKKPCVTCDFLSECLEARKTEPHRTLCGHTY